MNMQIREWLSSLDKAYPNKFDVVFEDFGIDAVPDLINLSSTKRSRLNKSLAKEGASASDQKKINDAIEKILHSNKSKQERHGSEDLNSVVAMHSKSSSLRDVEESDVARHKTFDFFRRMRRGFHFKRVSSDKNLWPTVIFSNQAQNALSFTNRSKKILIPFSAITGVYSIVDPSTNDPESHKAVTESLPWHQRPDLQMCGLYIVIDEPPEDLVRRLSEGSAAEYQSSRRPSNAARMSSAFLAASQSAAKDLLILIAPSEEYRAYFVEGLKLAIQSAKDQTLPPEGAPQKKQRSSAISSIYKSRATQNKPVKFKKGMLVEVSFDASSYIIYASLKKEKKKVTLPNATFDQRMYLRAKIKSFNPETKTYDLIYKDGPYLLEEQPDGTQRFHTNNTNKKYAKATYQLTGVRETLLNVDCNSGDTEHFPYAIILLSAGQIGIMVWHVYWNGPQESQYRPIAGPEYLFYRAIMEYPGCHDVRYQAWRLVSYQMVHSGYSHIIANEVMQLFMGIPINMVIGNLRFMFLYNLGVVAGALLYAVMMGAPGILVGASGGVYTVMGMHFAELFLNWGANKEALLSPWIRLFLYLVFIGYEAYQYLYIDTGSLSVSAHFGGFAAGLLIGVISIQNQETTKLERYCFIPLAWILSVGLLAFGALYYVFMWPPESIWKILSPGYDDTTCCYDLMQCGDSIARDDYSKFICGVNNTFHIKVNREYLDADAMDSNFCSELESNLESYFDYYGDDA